MDVFERVREVNMTVGLTDDRVASARARLLEGIDASTAATRKRVSRRPMFIIAGAVAGVAAATATVMVVGQLTAPTPQVEAVPAPTVGPRQPGEMIPHPVPTTGGTVIAEPFPGTTPQAGQYLSIVRTTERLLYRDGRIMVFPWRHHGEYPPISGLLVRDRLETYAPADRAGEWVQRWGPNAERVQFFPEDQGPAGELAWDNLLPVMMSVNESTSVGGLPGDGDNPSGGDASYAVYPTEAQALLDFVRSRDRGFDQTDQQRQEAGVDEIVSVLRSNLAPAAVRQTLLQALALSGGAEIVSDADGVTTYRIRYQHIDRRTDTVSIDLATGWVPEYTVRWDRLPGPATDGDMVPTDVPDIRMSATVSIVDAIP